VWTINAPSDARLRAAGYPPPAYTPTARGGLSRLRTTSPGGPTSDARSSYWRVWTSSQRADAPGIDPPVPQFRPQIDDTCATIVNRQPRPRDCRLTPPCRRRCAVSQPIPRVDVLVSAAIRLAATGSYNLACPRTAPGCISVQTLLGARAARRNGGR
jgi:hypothetical protein